MEIRSCELKTHLYTVSPHYCTKYKDQTGISKERSFIRMWDKTFCFVIEYTAECGYDERLVDLKFNHHIECDTFERCPINSYCNKQTNRCCINGKIRGRKVKVFFGMKINFSSYCCFTISNVFIR